MGKMKYDAEDDDEYYQEEEEKQEDTKDEEFEYNTNLGLNNNIVDIDQINKKL